jgi:hypothetical protein
VLGGAFGHEKGGLHAAAGHDRDSHGQHESRNQSPIFPETELARVFHCCLVLVLPDYFTCVFL